MADKKKPAVKKPDAPKKPAENKVPDLDPLSASIQVLIKQNALVIEQNILILKHLEYATLQKRAELLAYTDKPAAKALRARADSLFE